MLYCTFVKKIGGGSCKWEMKMSDICELLEKNQLKNCRSIARTGNFIFESDKNKSELDKMIQKLLVDFYQQEIYVFTQSQQDIIDMYQIFVKHIMPNFRSDFCCNIFVTNVANYGKVIAKIFENAVTENEKLILKRNICYWNHPKYLLTNSKFYRKISQKSFKNNFTLRTIGTIEKVMNSF